MDKKTKTALIQIGLVLLTIITTTIAGAEWMTGRYLFWTDPAISFDDFLSGFHYSIPFLLILTIHEFGHYLTAKYHRVDVTLPFYIPMWLGFLPSFSFGTMGAFIKIKDIILSRKHYFDIGVAGPLAGFVMAVIVIIYGYSNLPEPEYIYDIHPEYEEFGLDYADHVYDYDFQKSQHLKAYLAARIDDSLANSSIDSLVGEEWFFPKFEALDSYQSMYFNKPLFFHIVEFFVTEKDRIPNEKEIMHNPYLLAGLLAMLFTALNLLPIGQLDGGHIVFGMFGGKWHERISKILFTGFLFYAGLGLININELSDVSIESSLNFLLMMAVYLYFLYLCATSMFENKQDRLTYAAVILACQFLINYLFEWEGYVAGCFLP